MGLFLGSIYATMELDTGKLAGQIAGAKRGLTGLGNEAQNVGERGERSFMTLVKASALGNLAAIGFSKGIGLLQTSVGTAIKRVDTLNNSTRTFQNMGFSGAEITTAMDKINKSILGLPTSLDQAVRHVTLLAASTGDLGKSEKLFSALNNGILGFGGTTDQVNTAVVQLSQAFAGGRVYAQDWLSMINAGLGPALNAIAKEMGITTSELKEGLGEGSISVEDFQNRLIKLNEQGGGGLVSLQQIAQDSTKGIGTGFANMQTAITRGMAKVLGAIGTERISASIAGFGKGFEQGLGIVATGVEKIMPPLITTFEALGTAIGAVAGFVEGWVRAFQSGNPLVQGATVLLGGMAAAMIVIEGLGALYIASFGIMTAVTGAFGAALAFVTSPLFLIGLAIGAVIAIGFLLYKHWDTISAFAVSVWNKIKDTVVGAWQSLVGFFHRTWNSIVGFFKQYGVIILAVVAPIIGIPLLIYQHWGTITAFFSNLWTTVKTIFTNSVNAVIDFFAQLPYRIGFIIGATARFFIDFYTVTIPNFVMGVISWIGQLPGRIATFFTQMWQGAVSLITSLVTDVTNWVAQLPGRIAGFLSDMWSRAVSWFNRTRESAVSTTSNMISAVVNFFSGLPGRAATAISGIVGAITGKISEMWSSSMNALKDFGSEAVNFMIGLPGKMLNAIGDFAGKAFDKFKSVGSSMWNGFKDGLGIHSPSYLEKAMMAIEGQGTNTVKHLNRDMHDLNAMANTAQRIMPDFSTTAGADFAAGAVPSTTGDQIYNITLPNVREPQDFAREFKLATSGRG